MFFTEEFEETLRKAQMGYTPERFVKIAIGASLVFSLVWMIFAIVLYSFKKFPIYYFGVVFFSCFIFCMFIARLMPTLSLSSKKAILESDLLYSARHLLLRIESGSSLINSIDSVSKLNTNSSTYFRELLYDISLGMPLESAIEKAIQYSPSKGYTRILEEILSSLKTGSDIHKTLRATLDDITKQHMIQIEEYGKKLNPMTMFYMIIGTIMPSLGTSMLVVATSFLGGRITINLTALLSIAAGLLVIQVFFILAFRSLKPMVMQ